MDFDFITKRMAVGSAIHSEEDVQTLAKKGITHILNCRLYEDDAPFLINFPEIRYLWLSTGDDGQRKPPEWFEKVINFGFDALMRPRQKLYVHCLQGINRGPSAAYAILRALGHPKDQVLDLFYTHRPVTKYGLDYKMDAECAVLALGYE